MERRSKSRRQHVPAGANPVSALVAPFEARSLLAVLEAASASPTAAHRNLSLGLLADAVVDRRKTDRRGGRPPGRAACAADLTMLVNEVGRLLPEIADFEDFTPFDNRPEVLVRWGADLFRLMAGALERPVAVVNGLSLLARVIDRVLVPELGFGLVDAGELVLRRVDQVANALAEVWPDGPVAGVRDDAQVTQAEVDAVAALGPFTDLPALCSSPDRALAAANHYIVNARDLVCDPFESTSIFGQVIAARVRGKTFALPAVTQLEALQTIGADLAGVAARTNRRSELAYAEVINRRVTGLLRGSGHAIVGQVRFGSGEQLHSVIIYQERLVLALNVVGGLTPESIRASLARGDAALSKLRPGAELQTPTGTLRLRSDAKIARASVVAGPLSGVPLACQHPILPLMDLEWIQSAVRKTREDLWYFVRDIDKPAGIGETFASDLIDKFQVWRSRKSFYRGGVPISFMHFTPHESIAEWEEAASNAAAEQALYSVGLPPLRDWPLLEPEHRGGFEVGDLGLDRVYQVVPSAVPVAVSLIDHSGHTGETKLLWNVGTDLAWKIGHTEATFVDAAQASARASLRVYFHHDAGLGDVPLAFRSLDGDVLSINWGPGLQDALAADSFAVERLLGEIVSRSLDEQTRPGFIEAWAAAPPGIRLDGQYLPQRAQWLPDPLEPHEAVRSTFLRRLGEYLAVEGVEPGTRESDDAREFESRTVFPWLLRAFHETIAPLSGQDLLSFALAQLEQATRARQTLEQQVRWQQGFPVREEGRVDDNLQARSRMIRVLAFVVEEVLAHPPTGQDATDVLSWVEAVTAAELCLDSCLRSAALHHQLTRTTLTISDTYEVDTDDSGEPTDVDNVAYQQVRARLTRPEGIPIDPGNALPPTDDAAPRAFLESIPELTPVDTAMRTTLGFGVDAMVGVLNVATQWEASSTQPAPAATAEEVVAECVSLVAGAESHEFAAAIDWLTLRAEDLQSDVIPHWETERRSKRIATSPLVATAEGLRVLPWSSGYTLRILAAYLSDGRLPWPQKALPFPVNKALDEYRQKQNRQAEKDCAVKLTVPELIVRPSLKPNKAAKIGIVALKGEIDVLCVDPGRSRIWVVEVKDSYTPYSPYQVRRLIDTFNQKYVEKLLANVSTVSACATALAAALQIDSPDRPWKVHGLMAIQHPEPAAYVVEARVPFCLVDDVLVMVTSDGDPAPGPHFSLVSSIQEL